MIHFLKLAMAFLLIAAAPVAPPATTMPTENAEYRELLTYGEAMLLTGKPAQAIARYFDPIITAYETQYRGSAVKVYGARTAPETLFYMLIAAGEKRSAVAISSTWGDAIYSKAFALVDLARRAEAKPLFEQALALSPNNARYLSELGNIAQLDKDWATALDYFTRAAAAAGQFTPEDSKLIELTRAMRGQGFALTELGRFGFEKFSARWRVEKQILCRHDRPLFQRGRVHR